MHLFELFASPASLYVSRPLIDSEDFFAWVGEHFKKSIAADECHVTIAHSKTLFTNHLEPATDDLEIRHGHRSLTHLGDDGEAVVLKFTCPALQRRWAEFCDEGAKWDFNNYQPHITISYDGADLDLDNIPPFDGVLTFGPEVFAPVVKYHPKEDNARP